MPNRTMNQPRSAIRHVPGSDELGAPVKGQLVE